MHIVGFHGESGFLNENKRKIILQGIRINRDKNENEVEPIQRYKGQRQGILCGPPYTEPFILRFKLLWRTSRK